MFGKIARGLFVSALALALVACQRSPSSNASPLIVEGQVQQLASLVAAAKYLKHQCSRTDLPADGILEKAAFSAARQRGWETKNYFAPAASGVIQDTRLVKLSNVLYQQLQEDDTPKETQCAEFNRSLTPFIDIARNTSA